MDAGTGFGINSLRAVVAGGDLDTSIGSEQRDDEDAVLHGFPSIGPSFKVVPAVVVGGYHACVGRVAVDTARRWPVPVD